MPFPYWLARVNKVVTNRVFGVIAARVPPWAFVHHRGRRTGRPYATVVWMFRRGDRLVVALTYTAGRTEWLKNVTAAGGCTVARRGRRFEATNPQIVTAAEGRALMPVLVRLPLRLMRVREFLVLEL